MPHSTSGVGQVGHIRDPVTAEMARVAALAKAEMRLRYNNIFGTSAANPITFSSGGTTTGSWVSSPGFPTIASPNYVAIVVEPNTANEEIVYLTAYTSGGTSGTFTRAQEGTSGITHTATAWSHSPTVFDFTPLWGGVLTTAHTFYDTGSIIIFNDQYLLVTTGFTSGSSGSTPTGPIIAPAGSYNCVALGPLITGDILLSSTGVATLQGTYNFEQLLRLTSLDQMAPPASNVNFNSQRQIQVAPGIATTDSPNLGQTLYGTGASALTVASGSLGGNTPFATGGGATLMTTSSLALGTWLFTYSVLVYNNATLTSVAIATTNFAANTGVYTGATSGQGAATLPIVTGELGAEFTITVLFVMTVTTAGTFNITGIGATTISAANTNSTWKAIRIG